MLLLRLLMPSPSTSPLSHTLRRCNPSNPTGAVHPKALLEELAAVLRKWPRVVIIADEIYEQITFDETAIAFATIPGMFERTVTINGFSKGPAMTGFRLGYSASPTALAQACTKVQSQNTTSPSAVSQHAGIAALTSGAKYTKWLKAAVSGYREKRDYTLKRLRAMPGIGHDYEPQVQRSLDLQAASPPLTLPLPLTHPPPTHLPLVRAGGLLRLPLRRRPLRQDHPKGCQTGDGGGCLPLLPRRVSRRSHPRRGELH